MNFLVVLGLLVAGIVAWAGSSYMGARRVSRALDGQSAAERRASELEGEVRAAQRQIEAEQALLERLPDPVILLGADREILRLNTAARTALGVGLPALLRHPRFRAALERTHETGTDQFADISLPVPIARELYLSVLAMDGPKSRMLATLSDRTRERAVERMRADFVANASHELRTPLTSVIGFIDTLRGAAADDPAAQAQFLGIMAEQAQRMNRLIDDLLSLSRIELTEHVLPSGTVDLAELVDRLAAGFEPLLKTRHTSLIRDVKPTLPAVIGDEDQLVQVLQNLLENAIKYGKDNGEVRVVADPAMRAGQAGITLTVCDDGIGIDATHLPRLTERFYRVNTRRSRETGGTGLGLAIVKHIVNRHRGQLKIESAEGAGTTVTIWLPTARSGNPEGARGLGL